MGRRLATEPASRESSDRSASCSPPITEWPAAAKVSALDTRVTAAMFAAFSEGRSTIRSFARHAGASVSALDVGIGTPTGDIRVEAALSPERFGEIVDTASEAVDALDGDLVVLGEMGIGNTTASAAVAAALAGGEAAAWVGRGTGIDDAALSLKRERRAASRAAHRRRHRSPRGAARGRRLRARRHRRGGRRRPPPLAAGGPRRLRRDVVGAPPRS